MANLRQRKLIKKISENIGNKKPKSLGKVIRESGFSKSTSETPSRVLETKSFKELFDELLPEREVVSEHKNLLHASALQDYIFPSKEDNKAIKEIIESIAGCKVIRIRTNQNWKRAYYWSPDHKSRKDAIDMAYKIRGNYKPTELNVRSFAGWTNKELENYAKKSIIPARFADQFSGGSES